MIKKTLFTFLFFSVINCFGQKNEIGFFIGGSGYHGDIGKDQVGEVLLRQSLAFGCVYKINFHKYLCFRSSLQLGNIKGDDRNSNSIERQSRNLSFQSNIIDASLGFEFNFYKVFINSKTKISTPYLYAGLSFFTFNPQAYNKNGILIELQPLGTEGQGTNASNSEKYSLTNWSIPFGFGYKKNFGKKISISIEWIWHASQTDYLDDVSNYYVDESFLSDETAEMANPSNLETIAGKTRGNPNNKDWYNFMGITFSYKLKNKPVKCPKELLP